MKLRRIFLDDDLLERINCEARERAKTDIAQRMDPDQVILDALRYGLTEIERSRVAMCNETRRRLKR